MSNIKLKDHNWAAEGIYDTNQSKSQQTINSDVSTKIGQATLQTSSQNLSGATNELKGRADTLDSKYDNVVTVANTQPSSQYNKVWLPLTVSEGTQVPTWAEHQALESSLNGAITSNSSAITGLESAIAYAEPLTNNVVSRTYVRGDYFFLTTNNRLYQATTTIASGTSPDGKVKWINIGGFNHQQFKRICTSSTWSGSASDQVLPTLPITGSLSDYSEIKFVLRLASQAAEQTFMTDLLLDGTIRYMYIPFVQDNQYFASCIVEYSSGSLKVASYIATDPGWYTAGKQIYIYGK